MTRLILALLANALSQDVVDPSAKVAVPPGSSVPMLATSTPSPTEAEFVHEEQSDAEFDDVTWTSSLLLIGFVLSSMGILCLVNCFDEHIRKESWTLLSTTVSIFSAASFDFAVYRLIETLIHIFGGHEHDLEHDMAKQCGIVIGLSIYCLLVFVILHTLLLNYSEEHRHSLFAISHLGSHIYAFASILVFGTMQKWNFSSKATLWVWSIPFLAFVVMVLAYRLMFIVCRKCQLGLQMFEKKEQLQNAREVQIEASAISVAFLLVQALCYTMSLPDQPHEKRFMPITRGSPGQYSPHTWLTLFVLALILLAFSSIWSTCFHDCTESKRQMVSNFIGRLASVTGCWCLQRGGMMILFCLVWDRMKWYLNKHCESENLSCHGKIHMDQVQAANRAQILNAYAMSILAVLVVLVMDKIADWFEEAEDDEHCHDAASGLRAVMNGLGLLVGICWDKAFETAYETILEERSIDNLMGKGDYFYKLIHTYPITSKFCVVGVGMGMSFLVAYAWYWHIAPHAMKETEDHQKDINQQKENYRELASPKPTSHKDELSFHLSSESESDYDLSLAPGTC